MMILTLSLVALAVGPLVYRAADRASAGLAGLDGFVMVTISGLALVHIVPHAVEAAGLVAIGVALLGFLGPGLVERSLHRAADRVHNATLVLAVTGLVLHGFFDGVGIATPEHHGEGASLLGVAVLLHRLPVSITLWWLLVPRTGTRASALILAGLGVSTVAGFSAADAFTPHLDAVWLGLLQALIAGSVLHVVIHRPPPVTPTPDGSRGRLYAGIGALVGIAAVAALASEHIAGYGESGGDFARVFLNLALESAPALLIAFALAGVVQVFLPSLPLRWMRTGRPLSEATRGVGFGLPLPICSCGVIPIYQSLVTQSVPATAAMAFLVATPELGLDAILISLPLLGAEMTVIRVVAAVFVALVIGWTVGRLAEWGRRELAPVQSQERGPREPWLSRVRAGLAYGFGEIVDHTGPWLILGIAIAALVAPLLSEDWLTHLPWGVDVVIFALLGMPSYVCASGATPLVAVLLFKGVSPGAAIAFLLAGPATNITTYGILAKVHGRRIALAFAGGIAVLAIGLGLLVNVAATEVAFIELPDLTEDDPGLVAIASLLVLTLIFTLSVLRQGPRGFLGQIFSPYDDEHEHEHDRGGGDGEARGCC